MRGLFITWDQHLIHSQLATGILDIHESAVIKGPARPPLMDISLGYGTCHAYVTSLMDARKSRSRIPDMSTLRCRLANDGSSVPTTNKQMRSPAKE